MPLSQAFQKLMEGHDMDHCIALRHTIQDLIDQGFVYLVQPSVTTNPLSAHTTHAVAPPANGIHFIDLVELDDHIHMLSWDESVLEPIVADGIYEVGGVILGPRMSTPFRLVLDVTSIQLTIVEPLIFPCYSVQTPFVFIPDVDEVHTPYVDDVHTPDILICHSRR
ncbi:hypothetical protein AAG906_011354 [Vitis piasezkii]